jgi:hypothetical protein
MLILILLFLEYGSIKKCTKEPFAKLEASEKTMILSQNRLQQGLKLSLRRRPYCKCYEGLGISIHIATLPRFPGRMGATLLLE